MKKWGMILSIFLCMIAIGGLVVLFGEDSSLTTKEPQKQEQEQKPSQEQGSNTEKVAGIVLSQDYLIF